MGSSFDAADVVVAVIEPGIQVLEKPLQSNRLPLRTVKPFYRYVASLSSSEDIDDVAAEAAIASAIASLSE